MASPVVMHHGPVTLGAAWCLVLGAPGGGAGQAWGWGWVPPGTGGWARHLHGLGGVTCMFVISLTFGDVWGWLCQDSFRCPDLVLCGSEGAVDTLVVDPSVADEGRWSLHRPHTAAGEREPATPPRPGRETGPGSRPQPGPSAGGDPPGSGCHSYLRPTGRADALRSHPGRCGSGRWEDRMDYEASAPSRGPATGPRMRRWPGTMEQGSTLVVGRSGWILLLVPESTG